MLQGSQEWDLGKEEFHMPGQKCSQIVNIIKGRISCFSKIFTALIINIYIFSNENNSNGCSKNMKEKRKGFQYMLFHTFV